MNKNLLKRIASVATELDMKGFTKEAKTVDLMLLKLAQEGMEGIGMGDAEVKPQEKTLSDNSESGKFKVYQAVDLSDWPHETEIVLISARNEDEVNAILKKYGKHQEWGKITELPMMIPQSTGPRVLWSHSSKPI